MKSQKTQNSQHKNEEQNWKTDNFDFKTYYKTIVIKVV